jgi:signal transduction histidine kinase
LLAEVLTRAADNMRLLAGDRTLTVTIASAAASAGLLGDADHLYRVLVNLLDNAIRHTAPTGRITLALDLAPGPARTDWLRLQVCDDGCGIAPADLPRIFDRFYRADPSRARQTGNAGLGLAIAKSIVEAHGGSITAASTPGLGTTFTLLLPASPAPARFSANSQPPLRAPQAEPATLDGRN